KIRLASLVTTSTIAAKLAPSSMFTVEYSTVVFGVVRLYLVRFAFIALLLSGRSAVPYPSCPKGDKHTTPTKKSKVNYFIGYELTGKKYKSVQTKPGWIKVKADTKNVNHEGL